MKELIQAFGRAVKIVLAEFDPIVFKDLIRPLAREDRAKAF